MKTFTSHREWFRMDGLLPTALLSMLMLVVSPGAMAETDSAHQQAYRQALAVVVASQPRLIAEMERINTGQVAHFDFLQFEHLELLRHARALGHPPTALPEQTRQSLIVAADALLAEATALELIIADFLRAEAVLDSASSNLADLAEIMQEDTPASLDVGLKAMAQAALALRQAVTPARVAELEATFAAIHEDLLAEQTRQSESGLAERHRELATQRQLIRANADTPQVKLTQVRQLTVEQQARAMQSLFDTNAA